MFQYLGPTLQLLIGVFVYGEPFTSTRFMGFGIIWTALVIYVLEGFVHSKKKSVTLNQAP